MNILSELSALGVEVVPQGENLIIRPASKVPPELKEQLRQRKDEVLAALKARSNREQLKGSQTEPEPLGAERGYLTVEDMPELQRRLELSGWKTERRGDQLVCWTPGQRKPRVQ